MNKSFNKLLRIFCIPTDKMRTFLKKELKKYPEMTKEKFGKEFLFYRGNTPILLVAHMDTVHRDFPTVEALAVYNDKVTAPFTGLGADDRLGIFGILEMLERGFRPHVLFTDKEEVGGKGAKEFANYCRYNKESLPQINFMIELDRMNENDAAMYSCNNSEFIEHLNTYGYKRAHGTYTDICDIMPVLDRAGTNISVGYYRQHTQSEYFVISEYYTNLDRLSSIITDVDPEVFYTHKGTYTQRSRYDNSNRNNQYNRGNFQETALSLFDQRVQQRAATYNPIVNDNDNSSDHDECSYCLGIYPKEELKEIDGELFCTDCRTYSLPYYKVRGV